MARLRRMLDLAPPLGVLTASHRSNAADDKHYRREAEDQDVEHKPDRRRPHGSVASLSLGHPFDASATALRP